MLELEKNLKYIFDKLQKVQDKLKNLHGTNKKLSEELEEKDALIATLEQKNLELENSLKSINTDYHNKQNNVDNNGEVREELKQYIKVIDECLDHLKKI